MKKTASNTGAVFFLWGEVNEKDGVKVMEAQHEWKNRYTVMNFEILEKEGVKKVKNILRKICLFEHGENESA